jgi:ABC-type antimicrobial peptide transport system permease subunit
LYGVHADDWATIAVAGAVMIALAGMASAVPAMRALRLSPAHALRVD